MKRGATEASRVAARAVLVRHCAVRCRNHAWHVAAMQRALGVCCGETFVNVSMAWYRDGTDRRSLTAHRAVTPQSTGTRGHVALLMRIQGAGTGAHRSLAHCLLIRACI